MRLIRRKYRCEDDYWAIRAFLREVFLLNGRREVSWPLYRWDYWRWHVNENIFRFSLEAAVFLWETTDGRLAAVLHPEGPGEAFLQVHPAYRSAELELEMMMVAETQFATTQPDGSQRLMLWAHEDDGLRSDLLTRRGYVRGQRPNTSAAVHWIAPSPIFSPPAGYTIRALGTRASSRRAVGSPGEHSIPTSRMRNTRVGNGIPTSSARPSTAVTWTWWRSPPMASWRPFAPSGSTM